MCNAKPVREWIASMEKAKVETKPKAAKHYDSVTEAIDDLIAEAGEKTNSNPPRRLTSALGVVVFILICRSYSGRR